MVDFNKVLKNANANWKKAKKRVAESDGGFQEYEDGRYTARLVSAKLGQSESSGRNQITFGWKFEDGEYEGKTKNNYQGIDTEDNLYFLGRDLERLGYQMPDDLMDLPDILADIEKSKPLALITLKTKGDFQNLYIRKVLADDAADEATDDEEEEQSEDVADTEESADEEGEASEEEGDADEDAGEDADEEEGTEEEEATEDDGDEIDITEGMRVIAETAKGREPGVIVGLLPDDDQVRVKLDGSGKVVRVSVERIEAELEEAEETEEEEEVEEAPAKKPAKKPAPAPVKKGGPAKKPAPAKKTVAKKPAPPAKKTKR